MNHLTNIIDYLCDIKTSIREVLSRINQTIHIFQLVVDKKGKLIGIITDGDIRRAIIRGVSLDDSVKYCMNDNPKIGKYGEDKKNRESLYSMKDMRTFLPILDNEGIVKEILVTNYRDEKEFQVLIMAGGKGTRLGSRTKNIPKPLLEIGDKPILEHILERIEETTNVSNVYVSTHHMADQVELFISNRKNKFNTHIIRENSPLGTAGAIEKVKQSNNKVQPLLVMNGDVITNIDISALIKFHYQHNYDSTIAVAQHEVSIPYGVIRHSDDGIFQGIDEKPLIKNFIAAGIYYLSPELMSLVQSEKYLDMPALLTLGKSIGLQVGIFPIHEYWVDIGSPEDFELAENESFNN